MQTSKTLSLAYQDTAEDSVRDIKKVAKGAGVSFIGSATGRGLSILCQIIIARFFGTEIFGLYTLGFTLLRMTELVARFGIDTGAMRFVSISQKDNAGKVKGVLISAVLISFINGIVLGGIVYFFAEFVSESIFHKPALTGIIKTFALCVPFIATMTVIAAASQGFHTTKYAVYIKDIIQPSANIAFVILLIQLGYGIFWVVNAFVISHVIALLAGFYFLANQFPEIKEKTLKPVYENKRLLSYSVPFLLSGIVSFLMLWTDIAMLGYMKTPVDVGIYRAASQVSVFLVFISVAFSSLYAPTIAEMYYLGQTGRLLKIFKTTTRWIFLLALPITLFLVFSAKDVMSIYGSDYIDRGAPVLIVLAIAQFANCATGDVGSTLAMTGKQNVVMINSFAMIIINIALNYFLIPRYGGLGAAVATGISIVAINLIQILEVYIFHKIHPYNMGYIQGIAYGLIASTILYFLGVNLQGYSVLIKLILNSLVVSIVFIVSFIVVGIRDDDRFILDAIFKKLKIRVPT